VVVAIADQRGRISPEFDGKIAALWNDFHTGVPLDVIGAVEV
jgi:hypothetical protein